MPMAGEMQHQPGRLRQGLAVEHRERVVDGERRAVRVADHVDRLVRAAVPAQVEHRQLHRRLHVLDAEA